MESISLAISTVFTRKNLKRWLVFLVYAIITAVGLFSIFYLKSFPDCYIEGVGLTTFKKISEYIISSILILTIFLFYSVRKKLERNILELLFASIVLSAISEIFFTTYVSVYVFSNAIGYIFKALSFFLIYVIFVRTSIEQPYKVVFSAVEREKNAFKNYLENTAVMFLVLDRNGDVNLINKKGVEILGYSKEEVIGKNWFDNFIPEGMRNEIRKVFKEVIAGNADLLEYYENPVLTKDSKQKIIAFRNNILTDDMGDIVGTLSSGEDITERMLYEKKLKDFASEDDLTGVLNKRAGVDVLNHVLERSKTDKIPFTICFMDFDGLKFVNDNFGHDKGDAYIISMVNALKESIRDTMIRVNRKSINFYPLHREPCILILLHRSGELLEEFFSCKLLGRL